MGDNSWQLRREESSKYYSLGRESRVDTITETKTETYPLFHALSVFARNVKYTFGSKPPH